MMFPAEVIQRILLFCSTPEDYLSQSLINSQWYAEASRLQTLMKRRFARQTHIEHCRSIMWDYEQRLTVIGHHAHLQRHGREEWIQTFHRVGGPSAEVYYFERQWQNNRLQGEEILREINAVWYEHFPLTINDPSIEHPYSGLIAVDSMRNASRHTIVPAHSVLPPGCDYLGRIVFRHQWIDGSIEDSRLLPRTHADVNEVEHFYELIDEKRIFLSN